MVVARGVFPLRIGERVTGQTEAGEIYTAITRQNDMVWVESDGDKRGWLGGDQVVALSDAESVFDALILRAPRSPVHYERRAVMWSKREEMDKAAADWDRAIELGSRNPSVYMNRGIYRSTTGAFQQAVEDYSQAIALGLKDAYIYANRGVAQYA
ncbi:MAG: hypothetical protein JJ992_21905, partial [Planctomycetes bacterium]|nr:hypothetical protein [Planctomycetota bacterium]